MGRVPKMTADARLGHGDDLRLRRTTPVHHQLLTNRVFGLVKHARGSPIDYSDHQSAHAIDCSIEAIRAVMKYTDDPSLLGSLSRNRDYADEPLSIS